MKIKPTTLNNIFMVLGLSLIATEVFARYNNSGDLSTMASTIKNQAVAVAMLLNVAAYVAGVGFAFAGILQFKAHKDNPQQTPLSKAVVMVVVAACLLFLPSIMDIAGASLFGRQGQQSLDYRVPMDGM